MIPPDLLRDLTASSSDLASCHSSTLGRLAAAANDATCSADHRKSVFLAGCDVPMTGAAPESMHLHGRGLPVATWLPKHKN